VSGSSSFLDVARRLSEENARAFREVYLRVLADPRTGPAQRARAEARIQQLDDGVLYRGMDDEPGPQAAC
jgi:hypothetical protein